MQYHFNNSFGQYDVILETKKMKTIAIIKSCNNKEMLLHHIRILALENDCQETYATAKTNIFGVNPSYSIDSYESSLNYESDEAFSLFPLSLNQINDFITISNEALFNVDNTSIFDVSNVKEELNSEDTSIGFIKYDNNNIGTYIIKGNLLDCVTIAKEYQGKHLALGALNTILSTISGNSILYASSRNLVAINLFKKIGFNKTNLCNSNWYQLH